jgi:2-phospho-L-lactate guanylyltransferase
MPANPVTGPLAWSLVIPVKLLAHAKTRLAPLAGPYRPDLALAMAADTVAAGLSCPAAAQVIVVTDDERAARLLRRLGAVIVADRPGSGLNPALRHGAGVAAGRWPQAGIAAVAADLPALRPAELAAALAAAGAWPQAFLPDAAGTGTTLYTARPGVRFEPLFGPGSADRHRGAGAAELLLPDVVSVRRDVDDAAGLRAAAALGLGPHTAVLAARLSPEHPARG